LPQAGLWAVNFTVFKGYFSRGNLSDFQPQFAGGKVTGLLRGFDGSGFGRRGRGWRGSYRLLCEIPRLRALLRSDRPESPFLAVFKTRRGGNLPIHSREKIGPKF